MATAASKVFSQAQVALAYHERTKHRLDRYAAGPETLDWDAQPNPFREYAGCARLLLRLPTNAASTSMAEVYSATTPPAPLTRTSVSALLYHSMALSAWKEFGPDRWALRCNPSSGNLHPTEAYVLARNIAGIDDGLHHYVSRDHALELRNAWASDAEAPSGLWIALSSIYWREAWKYGERAFRYCLLDVGHALGAIRYAAGLLGWKARLVDDVAGGKLAALLGLDRDSDYARAEREDAEVLLSIDVDTGSSDARCPPGLTESTQWAGRANLLDSHPMYRWPVIADVSAATCERSTVEASAPESHAPLSDGPDGAVAEIIRSRRSAQRFDAKFSLDLQTFVRLLDALLARQIVPWDIWRFTPRVHPILIVHRVEGVASGLYALPRTVISEQSLRRALRPDFEWQRVSDALHLPLFRLAAGDCRAIAKTISCHQAIAGDSCFSVAMLSEFQPLIERDAWRYRQLHWEAGLLGHVLYLEAEAAGFRGTGIGCFFDDSLHDLLGLQSTEFQCLYHFTVGRPLTDDRISTLPAYAEGRT